MDPADLAHARHYCSLVGATDLFEHLGLGEGPAAEDATAALSRLRRRMQSMQSNPKHRDAARYLIKHYGSLCRVLESPDVYAVELVRSRAEEQLPFFELAIEGVLADSVFTWDERVFLLARARELGIPTDSAIALMEEHAHRRGVALPKTEDAPRRESDTQRLRGVEGRSWWSAAFTRALLDFIPAAPGDLVDVYCREGLSAHTLLPERRQLTWTGVDHSPDRLDATREALPGQRVVQGTPQGVPLPDGCADVVLSVRALTHLPETQTALAEMARLLRPGGRLVVVEPDGLAETFYANGHLTSYNTAFRYLAAKVDRRMRVGSALPPHARPGLSLGPDLERRVQAVGLTPLRTTVHASLSLRRRTLARFVGRLSRYPQALAQSVGMSADDPDVAVCQAEAQALRETGDAQVVSGNLLPLFVCAAEKPL